MNYCEDATLPLLRHKLLENYRQEAIRVPLPMAFTMIRPVSTDDPAAKTCKERCIGSVEALLGDCGSFQTHPERSSRKIGRDEQKKREHDGRPHERPDVRRSNNRPREELSN